VAAGQEQQQSGPVAAPGPPRRMLVLAGVALLVLTLDIISKVLIVAELSPTQVVHVLGDILRLRVDRNPGAAFGLGATLGWPVTVLYSAIAIGVITVILRSSRNIRSVPWAITLGLLLGGATGNLTDRIFRSPGVFRGWVVDWIQLPHWPVFNVADSAIVCGGVLAVLLSARGVRLDGVRVAAGGGRTHRGGDSGE
jgi:signal peptidase II